MPPTVLQQLVDAAQGQHWLAIIAIAALYVRKLASPQSGFPITIPTTWLPTVSAGAGLVYGFVTAEQTGEPVGTAILGCVATAATSGFANGLLTAIFAHSSAPAWARALVGIFDDIGGGGGAPVAKVSASHAAGTAFGVRPELVATGVPSLSSKPDLPASKRDGLLSWATTMIAVGIIGAIVAAGGSISVGCGTGQIFGPGSNVPADLEADASCVAGQLLAGNLNASSVASICKMEVNETFSDLWTFLVDALSTKGKLTPGQASEARDALTKAKAVAK